MADYFTQFSFVLNLPKKTLDLIEELLIKAPDFMYHTEHASTNKDSEQFLEALSIEALAYLNNIREQTTEQNEVPYTAEAKLRHGTSIRRDAPETLSIFTEITGDVECVADIIHHVMWIHEVPNAVHFSYALTCSRPLPDTFSGGLIYITRESWDVLDDGVLLKVARESFEKNSRN